MDQTTHEVRLANWKTIIEQCQARPKEQSAKQWLAENGISEKRYYYWLRRVRKAAIEEKQAALPAEVIKQQQTSVPYVELDAQDIFMNDRAPAVVIKTKKSTIEISSAVSEDMMLKLVKAVAHAL